MEQRKGESQELLEDKINRDCWLFGYGQERETKRWLASFCPEKLEGGDLCGWESELSRKNHLWENILSWVLVLRLRCLWNSRWRYLRDAYFYVGFTFGQTCRLEMSIWEQWHWSQCLVDQTPQDGGAAWAGERAEGGTPGRPDQVVKGKPGELITTETNEKEHFSMEMRSGVMQVKEVSKKENQQTFLPVLE